jgi:flagellar biogenesis protein FliO
LSDLIVPVIAFAIVLALCYYTTKFLGRKFAGGKNKIIKIVETLSLGIDRYLYLISVGKKYYLFYSSKKGMELVSEIETDEPLQSDSQETGESAGIFDFKKIFDTYSGLSLKRNGTEKNSENIEPEAEGILKNIKRLQKINNNK